MSAVVSLSSERLRRQLHASVDLLDLGSVIRDTGAMMLSAGTHVMQVNELPTAYMLDEIEFMAMTIVRMANELRHASSASSPVALPADTETS